MISSTSFTGSILGRLADNSAAVKRQLDAASVQQSTGKRSETYAGLGDGARVSLNLRPAVQRLETWQDNISRASGRLEVTQTVLKQITDIASDFRARTNNLNQVGASQAATISAAAKVALGQVAQLLNTKVGDVYLFAGQDTANPPVPNTDAAVVGAAVLASETSVAPFSATIGSAPPQIEVEEGSRVSVGVLANRNTLVDSAAPTSGSYMRDILRGLATLAGVTEGAGLEPAAADARARLGSAIGAIANESGALGDLQAGLTARKDVLATTQTALTRQVSDAEDVDLAETLTRVAALQTQLQASYQVFAGAKNLSLTNFL